MIGCPQRCATKMISGGKCSTKCLTIWTREKLRLSGSTQVDDALQPRTAILVGRLEIVFLVLISSIKFPDSRSFLISRGLI